METGTKVVSVSFSISKTNKMSFCVSCQFSEIPSYLDTKHFCLNLFLMALLRLSSFSIILNELIYNKHISFSTPRFYFRKRDILQPTEACIFLCISLTL